MPRQKKGLTAGMAPRQPEDVMPPRTYDLTIEERAQLRIFVEGPLWRKCLSNARTAKPPLHVNSGPESAQKNNDQFCRLQGWELCEMAIMAQVLTPPQKRVPTPETYGVTPPNKV